MVGSKISGEKCHFLHQDDPFLRLGPHKMEILNKDPFRIILQDFLSKDEIDYLVRYATPRLFTERGKTGSNMRAVKKSDTSKKVRLVHSGKTTLFSHEGNTWLLKKTDEMDSVYPLLVRISRKIEVATSLNVLGQYSSTPYQTTNYGLGGLCETHIDPHGYIEGVKLTPERQGLMRTGDMTATFMAWLNDIDAGGYTAFDYVNYELRLQPQRGSAGFWFDLDKKGHRELRSSHMGCPVLSGSKWILNKWIYYFDQFKNYPCGLNSHEPMEAFTKYYI